MPIDPQLSSPGLSRRHWLSLTVVGGALTLVGCRDVPVVGATFLQPWQDHLHWPPQRWRRALADMAELECEELFLQWVGLEGESEKMWAARGTMLQSLMDEAATAGIGVHLGLPYNQNWWNVIPQKDDAVITQFLQATGSHCASYMRSVTWNRHPAFRGWYIPYELEQYHWGSSPRLEMLSAWLKGFSDVSIETCGREPTVSTYYSELASSDMLAQMWSVLLDQVIIRPMVQDGVGVHGIDNYVNLEPLHQMLLKRGANFDLIVELFERLPTSANLVGQFRARTAGFDRLRSQWDVALNYGAKRIVAYALEPWVSQDSDEGKQLRNAWRSALPAKR